MRSRLFVGLFATFSALLLAWAIGSSLRDTDPSPSAPSMREHAASADHATESASLAKLADSVEAAERKLREGLENRAVAEPQAVGRSTEPPLDAERTWPREFKRTNFDLLEYFVSNLGEIRLEVLPRHVDLNPGDRSLDVRQVEDLGCLVTLVNECLGTVREQFRAIRSEEMREAIAAGSIPFSQPRLPHESTLRTYARSEMGRGKYPGMTLEQVVARYKEEGRLVSLPSGGGLFHQGRVYRYEDFHDLPQSEQAFELVKYAAFDALTVIGGWFVDHGYVGPADLADSTARHGNPTLVEHYARSAQRRSRRQDSR